MSKATWLLLSVLAAGCAEDPVTIGTATIADAEVVFTHLEADSSNLEYFFEAWNGSREPADADLQYLSFTMTREAATTGSYACDAQHVLAYTEGAEEALFQANGGTGFCTFDISEIDDVHVVIRNLEGSLIMNGGVSRVISDGQFELRF